MHSVFTPEKRYKPKEVFTQCHFCGKYVIIRMSPETGVYSKCTHCFNTPFSSGNETVFDKLGTSFSIVDLNVPKKPEVRVRKGAAVQETPPHGPSRADGSFKCGHCGKLFTRNWYLKQHIKLHSNEKPFACDHCDKRFLNSSNLKQHMRTHSIEYRCCVCNKTCISQAALKEHTMKHDTDEAKKSSARTRTEKAEDLRVQRLHCNFCKQTFVDDRRLKEHIQTHTRETPYHCDKCDKAFRYNSTLMKHMKLHDGSAMFSFQLKQVSRVNKNASGLSTSTRQSGFTSPVQTAR